MVIMAFHLALLSLSLAWACLPPNATHGFYVQEGADSLSSDGSECYPYDSLSSALAALPAEGGGILVQPSSKQWNLGGLTFRLDVWIDGQGGDFILDSASFELYTLVLRNMTLTSARYVNIWVIGTMIVESCTFYAVDSDFALVMGTFIVSNSNLNSSNGGLASPVSYSASVIFRDSMFKNFPYVINSEFWMFRTPSGSGTALLIQNCTMSHFLRVAKVIIRVGITMQETTSVNYIVVNNSRFDDFTESVFTLNLLYYNLSISGSSFSRGPVAIKLQLNDNQTHAISTSQFTDVKQAVSISILSGLLTISRCEFTRIEQSITLMQGTRTSVISVLDSAFTDIGNKTALGPALFAQNAGKMFFMKCQVKNSRAKSGGVLYSNSQVSLQVLDCHLTNLVADNAPTFDLQQTEATIRGTLVDTALTQGNVFSFVGQAVTLSSFTLRNAYAGRSVFYGFETVSRMQDSLIENCSSDDQFLVLSTSATPCYISDTVFRNVSFGTDFIQPYIEQIYQLYNVTFHISPISSSGTLFSNFGTLITATKCNFSGVLALLLGGVGPTLLNECVFADLTVQSLFASSSTTLQLANSNFVRVKVTRAKSFPLSNTVLDFLNTSFTEVEGQLLSSKQSVLTFTGLRLQNCSVLEDSSWLNMMLSSATLNDLSLQDVHLSNRSTLLTLDFQSTLVVSEARFERIDGKFASGILSAKQSSLQLSHVYASLLTTSFITSSESTLYLNNSVFVDIGQNSKPLFDGGVLQVAQMFKVTVSNCTFTRVRARSGGALHIVYSNPNKASLRRQMRTTGYALISQCRFESCASTGDGAGIYLKGATATISESVFGNGTAESNGGALALYCDPAKLQFTCFYHINQTSFINNTADMGGGAIKYDKVKPFLFNVTSINNSAMYGSFLAAFPVELRYMSHGASASITGESGSVLAEPLKLGLYDELGQLVKTDSLSKGSLSVAQKSALVSGLQTVPAVYGVFSFEGLSVVDTPGSEVVLQLSSDAIDYKNLNPNINTKSELLNVRLALRSCAIGEIISNSACDMCVAGTYSFNISDPVCNNCPAGLTCHGGANTTVAQDNWRPANTSELLLECYAKDICRGGNLAECEIGYTGRLCTLCDEGYFRFGNFFCLPCGSKTWGIIRGILVVLGTALFLIIMIAGNLRNRIERKSVMSVHFRIFLNYNQVSMLMSSLQVKWPVDLFSFFEGLKLTGSAGQFAFSNECISGESGINYIYQKAVVMAVTPAVFILVALLIWGIVALIRRKMEFLQVHAMCSIIVVLLSMQPVVLQACLQLYPCVEVEQGSLWLLHDMRVACWQGSHATYAFGVALPSIVVWCVAAPLFFWALLFRQRSALYHPINIRRIGFLYSGYHRRYYFWEFVVVLRKSMMVITANLLMTAQTETQAEMAIAILWIFLILQHSHQPFETRSFNRTEFLSLLASLVTVVAGALYLSDLRTQPAAYYTLLVTAFAFNALFMFVWFLMMIIFLTRSSSKKVTAIWHWLDKAHTQSAHS